MEDLDIPQLAADAANLFIDGEIDYIAEETNPYFYCIGNYEPYTLEVAVLETLVESGIDIGDGTAADDVDQAREAIKVAVITIIGEEDFVATSMVRINAAKILNNFYDEGQVFCPN